MAPVDNNMNSQKSSTPVSPTKKAPEKVKSDAPIVTYETSGEGKKLPIVIFNCNALSQPQQMGKIIVRSAASEASGATITL